MKHRSGCSLLIGDKDLDRDSWTLTVVTDRKPSVETRKGGAGHVAAQEHPQGHLSVSQHWLLPGCCSHGSGHLSRDKGVILPGDSGQTPHCDMDIVSSQGSVHPWTYDCAQGQSILIGRVWVTMPSPKLGNGVSPGHPTRKRCGGGAIAVQERSRAFPLKLGHSLSV